MKAVLILLLLEYPLGPKLSSPLMTTFTRLNPSFSGIPAQGVDQHSSLQWNRTVLILLLLEYLIGVKSTKSLSKSCQSLNPSFTGIPTRAFPNPIQWILDQMVLILLVLEYPFGQNMGAYDNAGKWWS